MGTARIDDVGANAEDFQRRLIPLLRNDLTPDRASMDSWIAGLVSRCRERLAQVLPLHSQEEAFLRALNDGGEISPALLTDDSAMQLRIAQQPGLLWKARNVRDHRQR